MATNANPAQGNGPENSGALTSEKITYRGYVTMNEKGEITSTNAKAQSANNASWTKQEAAGATQWNENEFVRYTVHSDSGFALLVPDETQRLYIIQAGLNYVQNSKANAYMVETVEGDAATPKYNNETIDLKEAINEPPSKRALTDQQKLERLVKSMGLKPDDMMSLFADLAKKFAAQSAAPQLEEETAETEA